MTVRACCDASAAIGSGGGPEVIASLRIDLPAFYSISLFTGAIGDSSGRANHGTLFTKVAEMKCGSVGGGLPTGNGHVGCHH